MTQSVQALAEDVTPPTVVLFNPQNQSTNNPPLHTLIYADFSEPVDNSTVNVNTFRLFFVDTIDNVKIPVAGTVSLDPNGKRATFIPAASLSVNSIYIAEINKDCSVTPEESPCIKDLAGNAMVSGYPWSFTTSAARDNYDSRSCLNQMGSTIYCKRARNGCRRRRYDIN